MSTRPNPNPESPLRLGPILSLPPEMLNCIAEYLRPSAVLSFRQTCWHMYENACSKLTLKANLNSRVLRSQSLALACMMERDGRLPKDRLVCAACTYHHPSDSFDPTEKLLPPEIRICDVEKLERKMGFAGAVKFERYYDDAPITSVCSACKGSHRFDSFDVVEQVQPSEDRICIVFANVCVDRDFTTALKAFRWDGALDPIPLEVGDQDSSSYPAILRQLELRQARYRQLSDLVS